MKLNTIGKAYLKALTKQSKELNIYEDGDEELILYDCALQFQLYRKELGESLDEEKTYHHMKSQRHLKNVYDALKQLGLTPLGRNKLKAEKEVKEEDSIFDKINEMM